MTEELENSLQQAIDNYLSERLHAIDEQLLRLQDEFNELIQPEYSLTQLRQMIGLDLSGFDLDGPFPRHLIDTEGARGVASRFKLVVDIVLQLLHGL